MYDFTRGISKLLWQRSVSLIVKMAFRFRVFRVEGVTVLKDTSGGQNNTINSVRVFEGWKICFEKNPEKIFSEQLLKVLAQFFASVRKQDGTDYELGSFKVMQTALDRHLKEKDNFLRL